MIGKICKVVNREPYMMGNFFLLDGDKRLFWEPEDIGLDQDWHLYVAAGPGRLADLLERSRFEEYTGFFVDLTYAGLID